MTRSEAEYRLIQNNSRNVINKMSAVYRDQIDEIYEHFMKQFFKESKIHNETTYEIRQWGSTDNPHNWVIVRQGPKPHDNYFVWSDNTEHLNSTGYCEAGDSFLKAKGYYVSEAQARFRLSLYLWVKGKSYSTCNQVAVLERENKILAENLTTREAQIMSLCSILGVSAEENLEPAIRQLQKDYDSAKKAYRFALQILLSEMPESLKVGL